MKLITRDRVEDAIDILAESFAENKSVQWFLKDGCMSKKRLREFCRYCLSMAMYEQGAYFSNDLNGVLLFTYYNEKPKFSLAKFLTTIRFVLKGSGIRRIPMILKRQKKLQQVRKSEPHLYISLIASNLKGGNMTVIELKQSIFELSEKTGIPIYAETSLITNLKVYQRYGFSCYNQIELDKSDVKIWMLRRAPKSLRKDK